MTAITWFLLACTGEAPAPPEQTAPVDRDEDGATDDVDCDDRDPLRTPGADEVCDGIDNDCDLEVDDDPIDGVAGYADADGDGHASMEPAIVACALSPSLADHGDDCDDGDPMVYPGAAERCNSLDDDCDPATSDLGTVAIGEAAYATIQDAMASAVDGDTVTVCDGTWAGPIDVPPVKLTLASANGAGSTVLDGERAGPLIRASGGELTVRGFTFANAKGGGISARRTVLVVEDCTFRDNVNLDGGAIALDVGSLTVRRSSFERNESIDEDDWPLGGGAIAAFDATVWVEDSTFTENRAAYFGGAIYVPSGSSTTITGSTFESNEGRAGGAVYLYTTTSTIADSLFYANIAIAEGWVTNGGAAYLLGSVTVTDSVFDFNESYQGGAIEHSFGDLRLERVTLTRNIADVYGGALMLLDQLTAEVIDSVIHNNSAGEWGGGGVDMTNSDWTTLTSTGSDWGTGGTDNYPADVAIGFGTYFFSTQDFRCNATGDVCR